MSKRVIVAYRHSAILQLYHGENKLIFEWNDDEVRFVLDQHT